MRAGCPRVTALLQQPLRSVARPPRCLQGLQNIGCCQGRLRSASVPTPHRMLPKPGTCLPFSQEITWPLTILERITGMFQKHPKTVERA